MANYAKKTAAFLIKTLHPQPLGIKLTNTEQMNIQHY